MQAGFARRRRDSCFELEREIVAGHSLLAAQLLVDGAIS
jgi:hypothetical protein